MPLIANEAKPEDPVSEFDARQKIPVSGEKKFVLMEHLESLNAERLADQDAMLQRITALEDKLASLTSESVSESAKVPDIVVEMNEDEADSESEDFEVLLKHIERLASTDNRSSSDESLSQQETEDSSTSEKKTKDELEAALVLSEAALVDARERIAQLEQEKDVIKRERDEFAQKYNQVVRTMIMGNSTGRGFRNNNLMSMSRFNDRTSKQLSASSELTSEPANSLELMNLSKEKTVTDRNKMYLILLESVQFAIEKMRRSDFSGFNSEREDVASEFAKRMQKIPRSDDHEKGSVHMEHLEAMDKDRWDDYNALLKRITSLEEKFSLLTTRSENPQITATSNRSESEWGSDDFEVLSASENQRYKQLESALSLTQSALTETKERNALLERENAELKRQKDESRKAYDRLVAALENVVRTAKV